MPRKFDKSVNANSTHRARASLGSKKIATVKIKRPKTPIPKRAPFVSASVSAIEKIIASMARKPIIKFLLK